MEKRLQTLLVPYFTLNTFWFFVYAGLVWISVHYFGSKEVFDFSLLGYVRSVGLDINHTPVISALWYVRCLMIFFLVLPVALWMMRKKEWISWAVVLACFVASTVYECTGCKALPLFGFNVRGLPFFIFGVHILLWPIGISRLLGLVLAVSSVVVFEGLGLTVPSIGASLAIGWFILPEVEAPKWLRTGAFPVYVLHQMILCVLMIPQRFLKIEGYVAFRYVLLIVLSVVLSILVARFLSRYMPRVAKLAFGGRA